MKTFKRDDTTHVSRPERGTALSKQATAFEQDNEEYSHSALRYRLPREFEGWQQFSEVLVSGFIGG